MPGPASGLWLFLHGVGERWPLLRSRLPLAVVEASWARHLAGEGPLVAFLGDSLTAGWRLREDEAWPARLARLLEAGGRSIRAPNAGVSGDTVARGAARLPGVLRLRPDVLVVALGINDALQGRSLEDVERGLRGIAAGASGEGVRVLLVGVRLPPGVPGVEGARAPERVRFFTELYPRLAAELRLPLVPDLLDGVAGDPGRLFRDRLHPNASGHVRIAENVLPALERVLAEIEAARR